MASPSETSSRLLNIFHKNIVYTFSFYQREECFISKVHFTPVILYKNPIFFLYLQIITLHFMQVIFSINTFFQILLSTTNICSNLCSHNTVFCNYFFFTVFDFEKFNIFHTEYVIQIVTF